MAKEKMLHPMLYIGPKERKDAAHILGRITPAVFEEGPLSTQPGPLFGKKYHYVSEDEGRKLERFRDLFAWPEGTTLGPALATREEYADLLARVEALEMAQATKPTKATQKPKEAACAS